jgi:hypothetical protein
MDMEVVDYDSFKRLWDEDRTQRGSLGVQTYKIFRPLDNPFEVILHYEVADVETAEKVVAALRDMLEGALWEGSSSSPTSGSATRPPPAAMRVMGPAHSTPAR